MNLNSFLAIIENHGWEMWSFTRHQERERVGGAPFDVYRLEVRRGERGTRAIAIEAETLLRAMNLILVLVEDALADE